MAIQPHRVELKDGSSVLVRAIEPGDEPLLHEAFSRMSERSVYFRFFSPLKRLPEEMAHRLAREPQKGVRTRPLDAIMSSRFIETGDSGW